MTATKTVHEAFAAVMGTVQGISKSERNQQQGFSFRGIDAVLSAVGPALRTHGVVIVPTCLRHESERYPTKSGGQMRNITVAMKYTVYGPGGDWFEGAAYGEAADAGDKAMTKAQSVAYRTFLLQALTVPTDEPEPDSQVHERAPEPNPAVWAKDRLITAVKNAGIDSAAFAAWALSPQGGGINLREPQSVAALDRLTARVESEGRSLLGPSVGEAKAAVEETLGGTEVPQ